jgi:hypothetical protein
MCKIKKKNITSIGTAVVLNDAVAFSLDVFVVGTTLISDGGAFGCILIGSCCFLICC